MNAYRKILIDRVEANGGYHAGRGENFALSYDVSLGWAWLGYDHALEVAQREHGLQVNALTHHYVDMEALEQEYNALDIQTRVVEDMRSQLDGDAHNTYSPETGDRHGLPYHAFPKKYKRRTAKDTCFYSTKFDRWVLDNPYTCEEYDVKFSLQGRSGKHLCIESFEGKSLKMSSRDLVLELDQAVLDCHNGGFSNKWCQRLACMIATWDERFSSKAVAAEAEYQAAYILKDMFDAELETRDTLRLSCDVMERRESEIDVVLP